MFGPDTILAYASRAISHPKRAWQAHTRSGVHLRSVEMNRGDLAIAHKAKWDLISSMVSSSLRGSPICGKHLVQHLPGRGSLVGPVQDMLAHAGSGQPNHHAASHVWGLVWAGLAAARINRHVCHGQAPKDWCEVPMVWRPDKHLSSALNLVPDPEEPANDTAQLRCDSMHSAAVPRQGAHLEEVHVVPAARACKAPQAHVVVQAADDAVPARRLPCVAQAGGRPP